MGISCHHPLWLILLPLVFYPVYLWYRDSSHLASGRRIFITVMRIILLLSLVLALSGLEIRFPLKNQSVVFVVDLSASCEQGQERVENFIQEALVIKARMIRREWWYLEAMPGGANPIRTPH